MNRGDHGAHRQPARVRHDTAFAYGYHSESHSYYMNERRRVHSGPGTERHAQNYDSSNAGRAAGGGPDDESAAVNGRAVTATMSINSPSAQDSWHGYDVDCPKLNADE